MKFIEGALSDRADTRFIAAHELMHIVFHRGAPRYFKKPGGNVLVPFIYDSHESAEWQADRLARALLMPRKMVDQFPEAGALAVAAGVPVAQSTKRLHEISPAEARSTPPDIAIRIAELNCEATKGSLKEPRTQAEALKIKLWNELPVVPSEDANEVRLCGKYQIRWREFGKTTGCGWYIEKGAIVSFFATQNG